MVGLMREQGEQLGVRGFCGSYDIGFVGLEEGGFRVKWGWMSAPGSCYFLR